MSIFRCNKCNYIKEVPQKYIDKVVKCPKCKTENRVLDTVTFIQKIIFAYIDKQKDIVIQKENITKLKDKILKSNKTMNRAKEYIARQKETYQNQITILNKDNEELNSQLTKVNNNYTKAIDSNYTQKHKCQKEITRLKKRIDSLTKSKTDNTSTIDKKLITNNSPIVDNISNLDEFTPQDNHQLILDWFTKKSINIDIDMDAIDTRGFFDEVAISLGNNFHILQSLLEQIRYIQRKGYDTVKISLENRTKKEISTIVKFCKEIYDYSFASRSYHDRKKNAIYLEIQKATKITNFFNGVWMEWYIYMMLLDFFKKRDISHSLVRSLKITYLDMEKNELDIFFIANNIPICIECKSGEFRGDIDKYLRLKKRLKLTKEQFIICVIGLDKIQTDGLTNTYDITFRNQNNLLEHIDNILDIL